MLASAHTGDTVARIGGDEFVVISRFADQPTAAFRESLEQHLHADISIAGLQLHRSASVGIATTTSAATSNADLLRNADHDMYTRNDGSASNRPGRPGVVATACVLHTLDHPQDLVQPVSHVEEPTDAAVRGPA